MRFGIMYDAENHGERKDAYVRERECYIAIYA